MHNNSKTSILFDSKKRSKSKVSLTITPKNQQNRKRSSNSSQASLKHRCHCNDLKQDLFQFCDEFVKSKEYEDYVQFKRATLKTDQEIQYDLNDLDDKKLEDPSTLSKKALRLFFFEQQLKKYKRNIKNADVVDKQLRTINAIKQRIKQAKKAFFCHKKERDFLKEEKKQKYVEKFIQKHNINVSFIQNKNKIAEAILQIQKRTLSTRRKLQEQRQISFKKLVDEYRQSLPKEVIPKLSKPKNSTEDRRLKSPRETFEITKECKDFEVHKVKEQDKEIQNDLEKEEQDEEILNMVDEITSILGKRHNINLKSKNKEIADLIKSFLVFEDYMDCVDFLARSKKTEVAYAKDETLICIPNEIRFNAYRSGKIYTKNIKVINKMKSAVRVRFHGSHFDDPYAKLCFEVRPDDLQVLYPGLPMKISVTFRPFGKQSYTKGTLVFLTSHQSEYFQLNVSIECVPTVSDIKIHPLSLSFGPVPIWKVQNRKNVFRKHIKIQSVGNGHYKLVLRKIVDPVDAPDISCLHFLKGFRDGEENLPIASSMIIQTPQFSSTLENTTFSTMEINKFSQMTKDEFEIYTIVNSIIDDVILTNFRVEPRVVFLEGPMEKTFDITFTNAEHPGFFKEKYMIDVYAISEKDNEWTENEIGCQELTFSADVEGVFIHLTPEVVDFGICQIDTAYQMQFSIRNASKQAHHLGVQVPSSLLDYITTNVREVHLRADEERVICIRFLLRQEFFEEYHPCYDKKTNILHFPIKVKLLSKNFNDVPPLRVHVYSIITDIHGISVEPAEMDYVTTDDGIISIDMGKCRVNESVSADVTIRNHLHTPKFYCFKNVPKFATISPNYGIGYLAGFQQMRLRLYLNPQIEDICGNSEDCWEKRVEFTLALDSLSHMGRYRRKQDTSRLIKLLRLMLAHLQTQKCDEIFAIVLELRCKLMACVCSNQPIYNARSQNSLLGRSSLKIIDLDEELHHPSLDNSENAIVTIKSQDASMVKSDELIKYPSALHTDKKKTYSPTKCLDTIMRLRICCVFVRTLYEFANTIVDFPETPGTSFSYTSVALRPLKNESTKCFCGLNKHHWQQLPPELKVTFKIVGSSDEIKISPTDGVISGGESVDLFLLATPKIKDQLIIAYAFELERQKIVKIKMEEERQRKSSIKESLPGRRNSSTLSALRKPKNSQVTFADSSTANLHLDPKEISINYSDYYPAELALWREMKPYLISADFTCKLTYELNGETNYEPDIIRLKARCKAVPPDFIHDLRSQRIDFGASNVGASSKKIIRIQNLSYDSIMVRTSILLPNGPFFCPCFNPVQLPSEHFLNIPVTFTPEMEGDFLEHFEICGGKTVLRLLLTGIAFTPKISFQPNANVFRIEIIENEIANIPIEIVNDSTATVTITVRKLCEIQGEVDRTKSSSFIKLTRDKFKNARKTQNNIAFKNCYTDELYDEEIDLIKNRFRRAEDSWFDCPSSLIIPSSSTKTLVFLVGKMEKNQSSSKTSNLMLRSSSRNMFSNETFKTKSNVEKLRLAKYNIYLGNSTILKDVILWVSLK